MTVVVFPKPILLRRSSSRSSMGSPKGGSPKRRMSSSSTSTTSSATTSSTSSTSSSSGRRRLSVSFADIENEQPKNTIVEVLSRSDYTQEEMNACWYSEKELDEISRLNSMLLKRMQRQQQGNNNHNSGDSNNRKNNPSSHHRPPHRSPPPPIGHTYRGLENQTSNVQTDIANSISLVLNCYDGQAFYWIDNPDTLATLYAKFTRGSKLLALSIGLQDEIEALQQFCTIEDDEEEEKEEDGATTTATNVVVKSARGVSTTRKVRLSKVTTAGIPPTTSPFPSHKSISSFQIRSSIRAA